MQIEIRIDPEAKEPKIVLITAQMTDEVSRLIKRLSCEELNMLAGFREDTVEILEQDKIVRLFASSGKVYAVTEKGDYLVRLRLYELEERLDKRSFVRISNSEIINLRKVTSFDLSFTGTIGISLSNGETAYVSRRYVAKLKQVLGI